MEKVTVLKISQIALCNKDLPSYFTRTISERGKKKLANPSLF